MANHFTVKIQCKKYVKTYLEINCGTPAHLKHLPDLFEMFRVGLNKTTSLTDSLNERAYSDEVTIIIPPDWFYRYGFELSKKTVIEINKEVEFKVKYLMRQYVGLNSSLGISVAACIREFQDKFGFYESIWSFESIKKEFYRHGKKMEIKTLQKLKLEINNILLTNLSDLGTISQKQIKHSQYCLTKKLEHVRN
jgi:hypothetical protein